MKCEHCKSEITSTMRGALKTNTCPYCGEGIMTDQKAEQYFNLLESLDSTTFTNRNEVDVKIREKVANLLITNYVFMKVESPEEEDDLIVVDETPAPAVEVKTPVPLAEETKTATRKKSTKKKATKKVAKKVAKKDESKTVVQTVTSTGKPMNTVTEEDIDDTQVRSMPSSPKTPKLPPAAANAGLSMSDFMSAQNDIYEGSGPSPAAPSVSADMSPEEIMKAFPGMSVEEAVEALRGEVENVQRYANAPQKGLSGAGIKRLNR